MLPERVEDMLRSYKSYQGRCGFLRKAIEEAEKDIAEWKSRIAEELVGGSGTNLDGMPHGTTVGKPTERMALMLATGYEPEDLKSAEARTAEMRNELRQKEIVLYFVEAWMEGLAAKEQWLIEQIYFEGCTYNETARVYEARYGTQTSRDGIRRMRKAVVAKIAEMAK